MLFRIDFDHYPPIDGTVADVYDGAELVGSIIYSADLDQWNCCNNPGEISAPYSVDCAFKVFSRVRNQRSLRKAMIRSRQNPRVYLSKRTDADQFRWGEVEEAKVLLIDEAKSLVESFGNKGYEVVPV